MPLLLSEGHAVGALILSGVALVGTHHDLIQGAVVLVVAVVGAGAHGAFDGFVGMAIHKKASFEFGFGNSMCVSGKTIQEFLSDMVQELWRGILD